MENFFNIILDSEDYICGNKFIELSQDNILFCKTDYIFEFLEKEIDILITHNSDYGINKHIFENGPKAKKWFCQNKMHDSENLINLPIGLENFEPNFSEQSQFGRFASLPSNGPLKKDYIYNLSEKNLIHNSLVYLNFNTTTFPSERNYVKNFFIHKNWIHNEENVSWKQYYKSLAINKFCISPRGNGIDCHRIWEALYLRTIPIVKKEFFMEEFSDLPILFIDQWEDITEEFLLKKYEEIIKKEYNLDKLKFSYWRKKIRGN